jgi:hypothetical protein
MKWRKLGCLLPSPRLAVAFVLFCLTYVAVGGYIFWASKTPVRDGEASPRFPVLVITPAEKGPGHVAHIVRLHDLTDFLESHPAYGYLVPAAEEASLQSDVRGRPPHGTQNASNPELRWSSEFELESRSEGQQSLRVDASSTHHISTGWYDASDHEIHARFERSFPRYLLGLNALTLALGINVVGWVLYWWVRGLTGRSG